ncbi:N-acetylmuramoyl-L-alanine amidase family protein [Paenibacillus senegalensis]|uniref:N-acetylmuramoyl-L-alanine amidase family protein n=1 Tax=Paenibacillus senegalensis TaxID=1465766 RepID=UPI00028A19B8|nr:N-acetylmuramoyl-L-alanine amidase [Paenibacillus senegalensis]
MIKVFIDPGHGGNDPGAVGNGLQEKDLTLQIALRTRDILYAEYDNVNILMSRTADQTVSLQERTNAANAWGADYFLSIHINAGGGTGFETFVYPGSGAPTTIDRIHVHDQIMNRVDFTDRGKKTANFHVLRESNMSAVLTECGFIDRVADADKLKSPAFIDALARGHAVGVARAFNLPIKQAFPAEKKEEVLKLVQWQWKDLGDALSNLYHLSVSGQVTPAVITDYTWAEKAYKGQLTHSELAWLNMIVFERRLQGTLNQEAK